MKDCEKVLELLNQYFDGELSESDTAFVRAHLENCHSCKKAYDELLEIEKLLTNATEDAPAELCGAVMTKLRTEKATAVKRRKFTKIFGGVAVAAVISLTVLASPAILLVATGGAKAECNDMAEALSPSRDDEDNYYCADGGLPECDTVIVQSSDKNGKSETYQDVMDAIADVKQEPEDKISDTTPRQGKKYDAYLSDGSLTSIIITEKVAIIGDKEYEYELNKGQYILTDGTKTLIFEYVSGNKKCFKQVGETDD